jgi:hypothetical protein
MTEAIQTYTNARAKIVSNTWTGHVVDGVPVSYHLNTALLTAAAIYVWEVALTDGIATHFVFNRAGNQRSTYNVPTVENGFIVAGMIGHTGPNWIGLTQRAEWTAGGFKMSSADLQTADGSTVEVTVGGSFNINSLHYGLSMDKTPGTKKMLLAMLITWASFSGPTWWTFTANGEAFSWIGGQVASQGRINFYRLMPSFLPANEPEPPVPPFNAVGSRLLDFKRIVE